MNLLAYTRSISIILGYHPLWRMGYETLTTPSVALEQAVYSTALFFTNHCISVIFPYQNSQFIYNYL
jgi:hypothetical protein